jgi:hypothetical protein
MVAVLVSVLVFGLVATTMIGDWQPGARALAYFAISQAGWDLAFSPMAQIDHVAIGLAVALAAIGFRRTRSIEIPHTVRMVRNKKSINRFNEHRADRGFP